MFQTERIDVSIKAFDVAIKVRYEEYCFPTFFPIKNEADDFSTIMSYPRTSRAFRRSMAPYPLTIEPSTKTLPESLGPHDVVIRMHAVSLNFRDVAMLQEGRYPGGAVAGGIPTSDCAAEVVAGGSEVKFEVGDHVAVNQHMTNLTGNERDESFIALGGDVDGVLTEYAVFEEKYLVKLPGHLTWEEVCKITAVVGMNRIEQV